MAAGPDFPGSDDRDPNPLPGLDGKPAYRFRWENRFRSIDVYEPQTAEELKAAAEKKRAKALAENEKRIAAQKEWERRNVTPSLFENLEEDEAK